MDRGTAGRGPGGLVPPPGSSPGRVPGQGPRLHQDKTKGKTALLGLALPPPQKRAVLQATRAAQGQVGAAATQQQQGPEGWKWDGSGWLAPTPRLGVSAAPLQPDFRAGSSLSPETRRLGKGRPALDTRLRDLGLFDRESWGLELRCLRETRAQALQAPLLLQPDSRLVTRA